MLGCPIDGLTQAEAVERISGWASRRESRAVYFCNAHSIVTGTRSPDFARLITRADLAAPDGMPVAWMLRRHGFPSQERICGPDLMLAYCEHAEAAGQRIFLLGSDPQTLDTLRTRLLERYPELQIAGWISPPFRALTSEEDRVVVDQINGSGAQVVFVGLGCPKQERWIHRHLDTVQAVMIGVGAAFSFHAGTVPRAPIWMQQHGLEWLFRVACEPRKLWRRYLVTNVLFVTGIVRNKIRRTIRERFAQAR